jgi:hypothetical protein
MTQGQITENTERCEIIKNVINSVYQKYKNNITLSQEPELYGGILIDLMK